MVRLKDIFNQQITARMKFQFLMVRLKVANFAVLQNLIIISIPYGAIKSYCGKNNIAFAHKFQFLMVRLKELQVLVCLHIWLISIPYGAIKSISLHRL